MINIFLSFLMFMLFLSPGEILSQNLVEELKCDTSLWQYVYHKNRLVLKEECKTVIGIIVSKKKEKDGDYHFKLKLDEGQEKLLNEKNLIKQDSCLVIEPICVNKVTQANAMDACKGFLNNVVIPNKGQHVKITGSYVLDSKHGWMEIHPVTKIELLK